MLLPRVQPALIGGPSGSGKTTLLSLCAGVDRPSSGTVTLAGQSVHRLSADALASLRNTYVGFVLQTLQLIPTLTALEHVMMPVELRVSDAPVRSPSSCGSGWAGERRRHYPVQLSGGEQQRVALARAFMPASCTLMNLQAISMPRPVPWSLISSSLHREAGTTLMLVTHDLDVAQQTQRSSQGRERAGHAGKRPAVDAWQVRRALWLWKMAWRDSHGSRQRLLLAMAAISVGMAAFVAITAFDAHVRDAVHHQATSLLGADLVLSSRQPLAPETEALLAALGGEQSREISCTSMAYFPKSAASRLVQVRALEGDFPYYGALETAPALAAYTFRTGLQTVVDDGLLCSLTCRLATPSRSARSPCRLLAGSKRSRVRQWPRLSSSRVCICL